MFFADKGAYVKIFQGLLAKARYPGQDVVLDNLPYLLYNRHNLYNFYSL